MLSQCCCGIPARGGPQRGKLCADGARRRISSPDPVAVAPHWLASVEEHKLRSEPFRNGATNVVGGKWPKTGSSWRLANLKLVAYVRELFVQAEQSLADGLFWCFPAIRLHLHVRQGAGQGM